MDVRDIFDFNYIQQQTREHHEERQNVQIQDSVRKLKDFLDSTDKIEYEYRSQASAEFCVVLMDYMRRHGWK